MGNIGRQTTHLFSTHLPWKKSVQNAASCSSSASRSLMCLPGIRWIRKAAVAVPIIAPIVIGLPSGPWICLRSRRSLRSRLRSRLRGCLRRRLSCHQRSWLTVLPSQCPARLACPSRQSRPCCQSRPSRCCRSSRCCCPSLFCRCPSVLQRGSARHLRSAASCPRNTAGLLLAAIPSGGLPEPSGIEQRRCCRARQQHPSGG